MNPMKLFYYIEKMHQDNSALDNKYYLCPEPDKFITKDTAPRKSTFKIFILFTNFNYKKFGKQNQ